MTIVYMAVTLLSVCFSIYMLYMLHHAKKQIGEMTEALADIKAGNDRL